MDPNSDKRQSPRVNFERGVTVQILGIDGTWRRSCTMRDVSESGALLIVEGSLAGLDLKEFFLSLSSTGLAYRRCEKRWVNGNQIGVFFIKPETKPARRLRKGHVPAGVINNM
ncbi:MAG: PilZ domain-containing protein [Bradyrhizobiaceae bacterium]|nr:MAG: PilZ domain-containing protein [Bradyrhizobiaceae bacterium]